MHVRSCLVYALDEVPDELVDLHPVVADVGDLERVVEEDVRCGARRTNVATLHDCTMLHHKRVSLLPLLGFSCNSSSSKQKQQHMATTIAATATATITAAATATTATQ